MFEEFDLEKAAEKALEDLLPSKSRKIYEKEYEIFLKWCREKKITNFNEDALLVFFNEKVNKFAASTLWAQYSMLKTMLNVKHNVDISKFYKLTTLLKRKHFGYKPKKSKVLTIEQIDKFLKEASDETFLMTKVALIFGVAGACRGLELVELSTNDVSDLGSALLVNIRATKNGTERNFVVKDSDKTSISYIKVCKKYMSLRKAETPHSRFFVRYVNKQCTVQPVGKNIFGKMPQKVATFLNLPDAMSYTGHCWRRTSASLLADSGATVDVLKRHGGWKSATVAEGYVENSLSNKNIIAERIFGGGDDQITTPATSLPGPSYHCERPAAADTDSSKIALNLISSSIMSEKNRPLFINCNNVTVNISQKD